LEDERYDEALEALRGGPADGPVRYVGHVLAARVAARRGDLARARAELAAAREFGLPMTDPVSANLLGEALAAAGDRADIEAVYEAFLPRSRGLVNLGITAMAIDGPVSRLLGLLAAALGREESARRHFDDALSQLAALDAPRWTARTRREAERVQRARAVEPERSAAPRFAIDALGSHYEVQHGGARVTVRDAVGMRLLVRLVGAPGRAFHVLALVSEDGGLRSTDAGPMLDSRAIAAYRERAAALREELEEAESFGDIARAWQRRAELEQLGDELSRGVGLGGRARRAASASERARINVQRHLKKAIGAIAAQLPELGRHLERSVRTGIYCCYEP
jgi:tetratricopeptide (TPR) repeat protein